MYGRNPGSFKIMFYGERGTQFDNSSNNEQIDDAGSNLKRERLTINMRKLCDVVTRGRSWQVRTNKDNLTKKKSTPYN